MKRYLTFRIIPWMLVLTSLGIQECRVIPVNFPPPTPSVTFTPLTNPQLNRTDEPCGFVWAYKDLPDLSKLVEAKVQAYQTDAIGRAQAFGEDCVYTNGMSEFHALETDFYVTLKVIDLADEDELGDWILRIMSELDNIPPAMLIGAQEGFCEFKFTQNTDEVALVRVSIEQFRTDANGLEGSELYRMFAKQPK